MKPKRDWKILITVFGLLTIVIIAGGVFMIFSLNEGTFFKVSTQTNDNQLLNQKKLVQYMNDSFRKKTAEQTAFQENVPVLVDPSI